MSDTLLNRIVANDGKVMKQQEQQTMLLNEILGVTQKLAGMQAAKSKQDARERQKAKRVRGDSGGNKLADMLGVSKPTEREKKGFFDKLGDIVGTLFAGIGGLGLIKALGLAAIGGVILTYFKSPGFKSKVDTLVADLFEVFKRSALNVASRAADAGATILGGDQSNPQKPNAQQRTSKNVKEFLDRLLTGRTVFGERSESARNVRTAAENRSRALELSTIVPNIPGASAPNRDEIEKTLSALYDGIGKVADNYKNISDDIDRILSRIQKARLEGRESEALRIAQETKAERERLEEDLENQRVLLERYSRIEIAELRRLIRATAPQDLRDRLKDDKKPKVQAQARQELEQLIQQQLGTPQFPIIFKDFAPVQKQQSGGPITVPGKGEGDKVPMFLPGGSFVMNKNAAMMLAQGGLVPTLLEPGEKVFAPGQWGPMEQMMNQTFSRFTNGGAVDLTGVNYNVPLGVEPFNPLIQSGQRVPSLPAEAVTGAAPTINNVGSMSLEEGRRRYVETRSSGFTNPFPETFKALRRFGSVISGIFQSILGGSKLDRTRVDEPDSDQMRDEVQSGRGNKSISGVSISGLHRDKTGEPGFDMVPSSGNIHAILDGKVVADPVGTNKQVNADGSGYGNFIAIEHVDPRNGRKFHALYGHIPDRSTINRFPVGTEVKRGQVLSRQPNNNDPSSQVGSISGAHQSVDLFEPDGSLNTPYSNLEGMMQFMDFGKDLPGMMRGGVTSMRGSTTYSSAMVDQSRKQFAKEIAQAVTPVVVPVPMGGGGGGGSRESSGPNLPFPSIQSVDSSILAMEYKLKRLSWGSKV